MNKPANFSAFAHYFFIIIIILFFITRIGSISGLKIMSVLWETFLQNSSDYLEKVSANCG